MSDNILQNEHRHLKSAPSRHNERKVAEVSKGFETQIGVGRSFVTDLLSDVYKGKYGKCRFYVL